MKVVELPPIRISKEETEEIEERLTRLLREEIYLPLLDMIGEPSAALQNSMDDLIKAIGSGRITFHRGQFKGKFNAAVSRELRRLGAKWDRKQGCYSIPLSSLPSDVRTSIHLSRERLEKQLQKIDKKLQEMVPEKIADRLKLSDLIDSSVWKVERQFQKQLDGITVAPELTKARRAKIAEEYTNNMRLYIKEWTEGEITRLREKVQRSTFVGNRYETLVATIRRSYGVSESKAKFLARQETNLLLAKFKESRYVDAGVNEYRWHCVVGSSNHPVRPAHKVLDGKIFSWKNPPVVNEKGDRKNPGEDYNCRCFARPIVRFK